MGHALRNMPIRPSERQVMCGKVCARFLVLNVLGMGGKIHTEQLGQVAAAIWCVVPSVYSNGEFRGESFVDHSFLADGGR